jgi:hypothetical protein
MREREILHCIPRGGKILVLEGRGRKFEPEEKYMPYLEEKIDADDDDG